MKQLVKEWYLKYNTLDGVREHYKFITDEQFDYVSKLIEEADQHIFDRLTKPDYNDKLIFVYTSFLLNNPDCGFILVDENGQNSWFTIAKLAYAYKLGDSKEIYNQAKTIIAEVCNPIRLGLQFVVDEGLKEPYIIGNQFYVNKLPSEKEIDKIVKLSFANACTSNRILSEKDKRSINNAMASFMTDKGDTAFKYLVSISKDTCIPAKDIYESLGFNYVDRLSIYDKYGVYLTIFNEKGNCLLESHRLSDPVIITDTDKLFYALLSDNLEELVPSF